MNTISLLIPAYNEGENIKKVVDSVKNIGIIEEIIVIDDGSTDNTYEEAVRTEAKVIKHKQNKGYGAAIKSGIRAAKGDIVITMDADLQHNARDIERISREMLSGNYDMLIGVRDGKSHFPILRRPGKFVLAKFASYLAGHEILDFNSGLRAMKKELLIKMSSLFSNGFSFSTTSTLAFLKEGYDVGSITITASKRKGNKSQVKFARDGVSTIILILRIIMLFDPLKIFLPLSSVIFSCGFIYGLVYALLLFDIPDGSAFLMLSGLFIFCMGLIADQISAMRIQNGKGSK